MHCYARLKHKELFLMPLILLLPFICNAATSSPLFSRGYTVIPQPQKVDFKGGDFEFGSGWRLQIGQGVKPDDVAVQSLREGLQRRDGIVLETRGRGKAIELAIQQGSVEIGQALDKDKQALREQAYRLELAPDAIRITANAPTGLLYGVDTLVQLVKLAEGKLWLPGATITDWPDLENRFIYWDDKAHLDHFNVLERVLRRAAFYKINGVMIKLNGHFEYKSAPAVVEPYALSPEQLQQLTNYGLKYHVQLIPYLDGPAHIAWILKHPQYKNLREFPQSNYELCTTNPDSYKLLEGMYQNLMDANKGVKSFMLSTDEPYFVGLAHNEQCDSAERTKQLGSVGKVLAQFITKTAGYLHDHGRTVMFWGEHPLKPSDIPSLPSYLINAEVYGPKFDPVYKAHGIKQMVFTYLQGSEQLFPNYFLLPPSKEYNYHPMTQADNAHYRPQRGRVSEMYHEISFWPARKNADLIGVDVCGWGDSGLHPATFWLGFVTIPSWGWHPATPSPSEAMSSFYHLFYGHGTEEMGRVYQLMSTQAEFWSSSWEWAPSSARKPLFGNSRGVFKLERPARDQTLPMLPVPQGEYLRLPYNWGKENARRVRMVQDNVPINDELLDLLHRNLRSVQFNKYNLEVFLSVAGLYRQNLHMIEEMSDINQALEEAQEAAAHVQFKAAVGHLDRALDIAETIREQRNRELKNVRQTWYKTWFPRVEEANGRRFLFELNSVHDYRVDRTLGLKYLIDREFLLPIGKWFKQVEQVRNRYASAHNLPVQERIFNWQDTTVSQ